MARTHSDREVEASGVRRTEVSQGVSSASAARTRTLGGETHEFRAVDYRPPQGVRSTTDTRPEAVAPSSNAHLGRAAGVSSLRGTGGGAAQRKGGGAKEPLPRRTVIVLAVVLAVLAVAVFVGGYLFANSVLEHIDEGVSSESSASYATDSYTLLAVAGDDGSLSCAYLGYVDTINDRVEFCRLEANTSCGDDATLASSFREGGLSGLADEVAEIAGVDVATAVSLNGGQMDALLLLSTGEGTLDAASLAADIWNDSQMITSGALRGLLSTIAQVPSENQVVVEAPAEEAAGDDGETVLQLDPESWPQTVSGMRDTTGRS